MGTLYPESITAKHLLVIANVSGSGTYTGIAYRGSRAITDRQLLNGAREIISARRQHSSLFVLPSGQAMMLFHPNINYIDDTGQYRETDLRFTVADTYAYQISTANYTLTTGQYPVASSITDVVKCKATYGGKYFRFWPVSLQWRTYDDLSANYLSPLSYVAPVPVTRSDGIIQSEVLRYTSPFGGGTRLDYIPFPAYFRKQLRLVNRYFPPIAIRGKSPDLEFKFSFQTDYTIFVNGLAFGLLSVDEDATTTEAIELCIGDSVVSRLEVPYAIDANNDRVACDYKISKVGSTYSITVCVPYAWWVNAVYPIIIDPEISYPADEQSGALALASDWSEKDTSTNLYSFDQGAVGRSISFATTARSFIVFDTTGAPDFTDTLFISGRIHGQTTGSSYSSNAPTEVGIVWAAFADDWKTSSSTFKDTWDTAKSITKDSASYQGIPYNGNYSIAFADGYFINPIGLTKMALIIRADYENDVEPADALTEILLSTYDDEGATYLEIIYEVDVIYPDSAHFDTDTTFGEFRVFEPKISPDSVDSVTEFGEFAIATIQPNSISGGTTFGEFIVASILIIPDSIEPTTTFGTPIVNLLTVMSGLVVTDVTFGYMTHEVIHTLDVDDGAHRAYPYTVSQTLVTDDDAWYVQWLPTTLIVDDTITDFMSPAGLDAVSVGQFITCSVTRTLTITHSLTVNSDVIGYK